MKSLLLIVCFMMTAGFAGAQDSWIISMNKKVLLAAHEPNETVNVKPVRSTEWKKSGWLEVRYKETQPGGWHHSLRFTDENGNELLVKDSTMTAKIRLSSLRKLFAGKKQLKIYMVIAPPDPMMAAPVRMIHLGTLKLP